jgi:hypothetical protein
MARAQSSIACAAAWPWSVPGRPIRHRAEWPRRKARIAVRCCESSSCSSVCVPDLVPLALLDGEQLPATICHQTGMFSRAQNQQCLRRLPSLGTLQGLLAPLDRGDVDDLDEEALHLAIDQIRV